MSEERLKAAAEAIAKECNQWLEEDEIGSMGITKELARDFAKAALEAADEAVRIASLKPKEGID